MAEKLDERQTQPAIVIQSLCIEKVVVEHIDLNNNLGQLGIRELSGKLNIGAAYTYGKEAQADKSGNGTGQPASEGDFAMDNKPGGNSTPAKETGSASASPGSDMRHSGPRIRFGSRT